MKKAFKLVVDEMDDANPTDISYVFSGYAPLSCRLVDAALKPGGLAQDEAARIIPGPQFSFQQDHGAKEPSPSQGGNADIIEHFPTFPPPHHHPPAPPQRSEESRKCL